MGTYINCIEILDKLIAINYGVKFITMFDFNARF